MSEPARVKIRRTRTRIYEMHQEDMPVTEDLQEPVAVVAAPVTEEVVEPAVPETETVAVDVSPGSPELWSEDSIQEGLGCELLQQDEPAAENLQEPAAVIELSAMEIAAMEFAAESGHPKPAAADIPAESPVQEPESKESDDVFRSAMATVYTYSALSAATGLIPLPLVDMAGFMAVQLLMLKTLSGLYKIPFDSQRSKSSIAILASGINSAYLAASSSKLVPFIGVFAIAAMPAVNGALSYAVGRVFIQHFASGGTFLDFDPDKVRGYFEEQYRVGKLNRAEKS